MPSDIAGRKPIVIMGPTACGKTELALALCRACGGELISVDSRQVYRFLKAGTAKPDGEWREENGLKAYFTEGVPCHLTDFLDPRQRYDAGKFIEDAGRLEKDISSRGKTPVFAGGTGMYVQAYWNGMDVLPKGDEQLRRKLSELAERIGPAAFHERLAAVDEHAARSIPVGNTQRILRALEVYELTGIPISRQWTRQFYGALPTHKATFAVIDYPKPVLHERITRRAKLIFDPMVEETRQLLEQGYQDDCPALQSIGYPQAIDCVRGSMSRADALHQLITLTLAYAKRQATWFRRYKNAIWLTMKDESEWDAGKLAERLLEHSLNKETAA